MLTLHRLHNAIRVSFIDVTTQVLELMPRSVIKTRMQSLKARQEYRNSLHCAYRIFTEEGVLKFWKGTVPRLGRLIVG